MYETYIYDPKACRGPLLARWVTVSLKTHDLGNAIRKEQMNYFFTIKVTALLSLFYPKSHGAILDKLSFNRLHGLETYGRDMSEQWRVQH